MRLPSALVLRLCGVKSEMREMRAHEAHSVPAWHNVGWAPLPCGTVVMTQTHGNRTRKVRLEGDPKYRSHYLRSVGRGEGELSRIRSNQRGSRSDPTLTEAYPRARRHYRSLGPSKNCNPSATEFCPGIKVTRIWVSLPLCVAIHLAALAYSQVNNNNDGIQTSHT